MNFTARKHNSKNTNYNQLKGSGILQVGPICTQAKCLPTPLPTPSKPIPIPARRPAPKPLIATKKSSKDNKWTLNGIRYPNFNTLWVNIPRKSFTVLKING